MSTFLLFLLFIFLIGFAGFHIFLALMAGSAVAVGGTAFAILIASICAICIGVLSLFLFAGFWIFIFAGVIALWILISIVLFPIFLPILLPLLILLLVVSALSKSNKKIRQIPKDPHD